MGFPTRISEDVYKHILANGYYEDLYVVSRDTYDCVYDLQIGFENAAGRREPIDDLVVMRGSRLGQRKRNFGDFGFNKCKYQYEYDVANKISKRMEYLHSKTGQQVFHIPIKDRWMRAVGHHHLTTKAFISALKPWAEGKTTLVVDDWHNGLMSFMFIPETKNIERMEMAHKLFEAAHKQYLIDNVGVNTNDQNYPYI